MEGRVRKDFCGVDSEEDRASRGIVRGIRSTPMGAGAHRLLDSVYFCRLLGDSVRFLTPGGGFLIPGWLLQHGGQPLIKDVQVLQGTDLRREAKMALTTWRPTSHQRSGDGLKSSGDGTSSTGNTLASQGTTWASLLGSSSSQKENVSIVKNVSIVTKKANPKGSLSRAAKIETKYVAKTTNNIKTVVDKDEWDKPRKIASQSEYMNISVHTNLNEAWDILMLTHEGFIVNFMTNLPLKNNNNKNGKNNNENNTLSVPQVLEDAADEDENFNMPAYIHYSASTNNRRYNLPSTDEIVVILPGDGSKISSVRDIIIYLKAEQDLMRISECHPAYLPSYYVLLFPTGQLG
ncbi:hypothetical protein GIB67_031209 [Kingdonia uniflora]|uniref:Uncharacterized protein n=1 Tax=Kingdonia uniflora TaxID=39325 RepID=A0A7J7NKF1_9MAGN|nr:hypothetical protein GIB67_031209 [Kingdonia uniflora]